MSDNDVIEHLFDYMKLYCPEGLDISYGGCAVYGWNIIRRCFEHWMRTGIDQLKIYVKLAVFSFNHHKAGNRIRIPNEMRPSLEALFNGYLIFTVKDLVDGGFDQKFYEKIRNQLNESSYTQKSSKRRIKACRVTSIKSVREAVFARDKYACKFCGKKSDLTIDHIIPIRLGGKDEYENFQTLCRRCNSSKSDKYLLARPTHEGH